MKHPLRSHLSYCAERRLIHFGWFGFGRSLEQQKPQPGSDVQALMKDVKNTDVVAKVTEQVKKLEKERGDAFASKWDSFRGHLKNYLSTNARKLCNSEPQGMFQKLNLFRFTYVGKSVEDAASGAKSEPINSPEQIDVGNIFDEFLSIERGKEVQKVREQNDEELKSRCHTLVKQKEGDWRFIVKYDPKRTGSMADKDAVLFVRMVDGKHSDNPADAEVITPDFERVNTSMGVGKFVDEMNNEIPKIKQEQAKREANARAEKEEKNNNLNALDARLATIETPKKAP